MELYKYVDLANFIPDDVHHLHQAVTTSLESTRSQSDLLVLSSTAFGTMTVALDLRRSLD